MVPSPRYQTLGKVMHELRDGKFEISIKGLDELIIEHDSVMVEACNSSFQVHFPVSYTHLRAHETVLDIVCRLLLEKKN